MIRYILTIMTMLISLESYSQNEVTKGAEVAQVTEVAHVTEVTEVGVVTQLIEVSDSIITSPTPLQLPTLSEYGTMPTHRFYPYAWHGYDMWDLHQGLNMSVGMRAMTSFNHGPLNGVGFGENIAMMYADNFKKLSSKLSYGVGLYMDNVNWGAALSRNLGITGILGYQIDDRWTTYLYVQKNILSDHRMPLPYYNIPGITGDRLGAAVRLNITPSSWIQFSFEVNNDKHDFFR